MEIAYDNLIRRLWYHGAVVPYESSSSSSCSSSSSSLLATTTLDANANTTNSRSGGSSSSSSTSTSLQDPPPIPHEYWVSRLGFQQTDPVTDFRSGGVLSLAMLVYLVESCPAVHARFVRPTGDASVLPMGITSINMTDMMSKFLMLAKSVDRMDALLSQKPFWRMFADPNALLACHELSMDMLADVVVELRTIRLLEQDLQASTHSSTNNNVVSSSSSSSPQQQQLPQGDPVTVFDFAHILAVTEKRVEHDLLGAGPSSVIELKAIHQKLKGKYAKALQLKLQRMQQEQQQQQQQQGITAKTNTSSAEGTDSSHENTIAASATAASSSAIKRGSAVLHQATGAATSLAGSATHLVAGTATSFAGNVLSKIKAPAGGGFNPLRTSQRQESTEAVIFSADDASDIININNANSITDTTATATAAQNEAAPDLLSDNTAAPAASTFASVPAATAVNPSSTTTTTATTTTTTLEQPAEKTATDLDGDWVDTAGAAEQMGQFSIGDDEDDDI